MQVSERSVFIEERLKKELQPSFLEVRDDSVYHANHLAAKGSSGGHYHVTIVSSLFEGKSLLQRHKMVYAALQGSIGGEIHAIQIHAKTADEFQSKK